MQRGAVKSQVEVNNAVQDYHCSSDLDDHCHAEGTVSENRALCGVAPSDLKIVSLEGTCRKKQPGEKITKLDELDRLRCRKEASGKVR